MAPNDPTDDSPRDIDAMRRENEALKTVIEESRRSEANLRERLARYDDIAESMPEWFWEVDDRFRFTYCSKNVRSILGCAPEEMIGLTPLDFIRDDEKPKLARVAESVFDSRAPFHDVVTWGVTRGGDPICSRASGVPFFDETGTFRGYRGVNEDITARTRIEESLRENERKFRSIVEESRDGIILIDEQGTVIEWNKGIARIFGIPPEETLGRPFWDIMPSVSLENGTPRDNREQFEQLIRSALKSGDAEWLKKPIEFNVARPDGGTRSVQQIVFPIRTDQGWMLGSISRDVTEERMVERVLRESEARFHSFADLLPQTVFETDIDGRLTFVNLHSFEMFGYTQEDFKRGINVFQTIASRDHDRARENIRRSIGGGNPVPSEYLAQRKDGSTFPMLITSSVIIKNGSPAGLRGLIFDITEQKQTELLVGKVRDLALILGSTHNLDEGLSACLRTAREISGTVYGGIYLMDPSGALRLTVSESLDSDFFSKASYFPPDSPNVQIVVRGEPAYSRLDEISVDLAQIAAGVGIQFVAVIPFLHDGRAIGALILGYETVDSLSGFIRGMLEGLVAQIGNSIGRLRTETALRDSEVQYRTLVENTSEIIARYDREYRHLYMSPAIRNAVALDPHDFIGRTNRELGVAPMEIDAWESRLEQVFTTGRGNSETIEFQGLKGKMVFDTMLVPERGDDGEMKSVLGIFRDITDRVTAQEALHLSEFKFLFIANQLPGTLWTTDRDLKFTLALGGGLAKSGLTPNLATGMTICEYFGTDDPNNTVIAMHRRALEGNTVTFQYRHGDMYYDSMLEPLRNSSGEIEGVLGIALDVTEREKERKRAERLEKQFLQSQKMEIIGRFAGGIAHDFNNILTVINAHAEISMMTLDPGEPFYESFSEIKRSGERAAEMTRRILSFSRREIVEPRIINCNVILLEMDKMLRRLIGENIEMVTIPDESLQPVHIDPGQVEQVLINLVVNARDAMPGGGTLTIETKSVLLDEEYARQHAGVVPGPYSMFSVSDTGIGMDEETLGHVFEPFYTTKPLGSGTGLGLSTCYGIVKQNNGSIWLYSEPDHGTSVKVYLPAVEEKADAEAESRNTKEFPVGNESVLVVEDDSGIRNLIIRLLTSAGYQIIAAANGDEALTIVRGRLDRFDLVITDIIMPLMGGPELVNQISEIHPGTPVLFMSGYTDNSIPLHGVDGTVFKFIQKPFSTGVFMRKVREILDSAK